MIKVDVYNLQGSVIEGKYLILSLVAHGGSSLIYLVKRLEDDLICIMKISDVYNESAFLAIKTEALVLKQLNGISVPRLYDVINVGLYPAIIIEYLKGVTLNEYIINKHIKSIDRIIDISIDICKVISRLHMFSPSVFYCDMKPLNVIILDSEEVRLIDFGSSIQYLTSIKSLETYMKMGTESYAAPEQFDKCSLIDVRTDIYGIGMVIKYMYTSLNMKNKKLEYIIKRCTDKDKDNRYNDCAELMCELLCIGGHGCVVKFQTVWCKQD